MKKKFHMLKNTWNLHCRQNVRIKRFPDFKPGIGLGRTETSRREQTKE
jgi:hypothetical protein